MVEIIRTDVMDIEEEEQTLWVYNGLDCMITSELYEKLEPRLHSEKYPYKASYDFSRSMLGPVLHMEEQGFRVNHARKRQMIDELEPRFYALAGMERDQKGKWAITDKNALIQRYATAIQGSPLNVFSPAQLLKIFYEKLNLPKQFKSEKGERKVSSDRAALEEIAEKYPRGRPLAKALLRVRDISKKLAVLHSEMDNDGRMRTSFNIAGTETFRYSSSESAFWNGMNLQNVTKDLRWVFVPDKDHLMFYADLKSAESFVVAYESEDENYIEANETGDPHTVVAKMIWPGLAWTGDLKKDKEIAKQIFYRDFSYRDMSKRGGHASNYLGTPKTVGMHLKVEEKIIKVFQAQYFGGDLYVRDLRRWGYHDLLEQYEHLGRGVDKYIHIEGAFPGIKRWQENQIETLQREERLSTAFNRTRHFWGRLNDSATHRKAIAFVPQSTVGDLLNYGLHRLWERRKELDITLFGQVHDAIVGQVPVSNKGDADQLIKECMEVPVEIKGRTMIVPADINYGYDWKEASGD